jgi:hypothetical protein
MSGIRAVVVDPDAPNRLALADVPNAFGDTGARLSRLAKSGRGSTVSSCSTKCWRGRPQMVSTVWREWSPTEG